MASAIGNQQPTFTIVLLTTICIITLKAAPVFDTVNSQEDEVTGILQALQVSTIEGTTNDNSDQSILMNKKAIDFQSGNEVDEAEYEQLLTNRHQKDLEPHQRYKRKISNDTNLQWPNGIVHYQFDTHNNHSEDQKEIVREAMNHIEQQTCIRFQEEVNQVNGSHGEFTLLNITGASGYKCASHVGRAAELGKTQELLLGQMCFFRIGTVIHELSHVLGLWHEHQRPSRDNHIQVIYANMRWGKQTNFDKAMDDKVIDKFPYDYTSVTHYAHKDNGRTVDHPDGRFKLDVIRPFDHTYIRSMGQRLHLSFIDAHAINHMYCKDRCPKHYKPTCYNGGYEDPNNCGHCRCPSGINTPQCRTDFTDREKPQYTPYFNQGDDCGGLIELDRWGTREIYSPGYRYGREYPEQSTCSWLINAPAGHIIMLRFYDYFGLFMDRSTGSEICLHWVQVQKDKESYFIPGQRLCGTETPSEPIVSTDNQMLIVFQSNYSVPFEKQFIKTGFRAQLFVIPAERALPWYHVPVATSSTTSTTQKPTTPSTTTTSTTTPTPSTTRSSTTTRSAVPWVNRASRVIGGSRSSSYSNSRNTGISNVQGSSQYMQANGITWSEWSPCDHETCKCGGYSKRTRTRLCNGYLCTGNLASTEQEYCSTRRCEARVVMVAGLVYSNGCKVCAEEWAIDPFNSERCIPL